MKTLLASIVVFLSLSQAYSQEELYFVSSESTFIRSGPGTNYTVVAELTKSMQVQLISEDFGDWWTIQYDTMNGFVRREDLIAIVNPTTPVVAAPKNNNKKNNNRKQKTNYDDWDTTEYETGETPECLNIVPEFDYKMENYLKIKNDGSDTEAVVKLIKIDNPDGDEITYRIAYIKSGDNHFMKNIPAGKYYLKIAYGKDWRETNINGNCTGKFVQNPQYEKGGDIVDFIPIKTSEGLEIPNYELSLDVEHNGSNSLETDDISEDEFNVD